MAENHPNAGSAPGNPNVTSIEPQQVTVRPEYDSGGVLLEVVDREGRGFCTVLDQLVAVDMVLKIGGSIARLRGWGDQS